MIAAGHVKSFCLYDEFHPQLHSQMKKIIFLAVSTALSALLIVPGLFAQAPAAASGGVVTKPIPKAKADNPTYMFVQNAKSVSYADGKLTLEGVAPTTIFFSDRPDRIAGHMHTAEFIPFWGEGKDSFTKDSPNATLSMFTDTSVQDVVVTISSPVLTGDKLTYNVKVLEGTMPTKGGAATLFIDVIGMPRTPASFAGAARRRAFVYR